MLQYSPYFEESTARITDGSVSVVSRISASPVAVPSNQNYYYYNKEMSGVHYVLGGPCVKNKTTHPIMYVFYIFSHFDSAFLYLLQTRPVNLHSPHPVLV